jgi:hypothetical protein
VAPAPAPAPAVAVAAVAEAPATPAPPVFVAEIINPNDVRAPPEEVEAVVTRGIARQTASHRVFTHVVLNPKLTTDACLESINLVIGAIADVHYPNIARESFMASKVSVESPRQGVVFVVSWPFTYIGISAYALLFAKDSIALTGAITACGIEGSRATQGAPFGLPQKQRWAEMSLLQQAEYIAARNVKRSAGRKAAAAPADGGW